MTTKFATLPGSSGTFHELLGYRFLDWRDDHALLELALEARHRNRQGWLHGGTILSLLDIASTFAGNYSEDGPLASVTLNLSCNFVAAAKTGTIHAEGRLVRRGRQLFFTENRVFEPDSGRILATAQGVHQLINGRPDESPKESAS